MKKKLKLRFLESRYSIIQLPKNAKIPGWLDTTDNFISITRTEEELTVICRSSSVPDNQKIKESKDWIIIKIDELLDLSLTGILYSISKILKKNNISIYAISTYNTDYILIKEKEKNRAIKFLSKYYTIQT